MMISLTVPKHGVSSNMWQTDWKDSPMQNGIEEMSNENSIEQLANVNILEGIRFYVSFVLFAFGELKLMEGSSPKSSP